MYSLNTSSRAGNQDCPAYSNIKLIFHATCISTTIPDASKLALIIGVDSYNDKEYLSPLPSCRRDAEDLGVLLSELGYNVFRNEPLIASKLDKEYGWTKIKSTIRDFFDEAEPGQTVLFYFSGHGLPWQDDVYLATQQVKAKNPIVEGISLSDLAKMMNSSRSTRVVCIIDACHSGAAKLPDSVTEPKAAEIAEAELALATYDKMLDNIPKAEGRYFLLSSQAYQESFALQNDNSLYTKYLINGLTGVASEKDEKGIELPGSADDDGNVTPDTLHDYVYHRVAKKTDQIPRIKGDRSSKIVLARHPQMAKSKVEFDDPYAISSQRVMEAFDSVADTLDISKIKFKLFVTPLIRIAIQNWLYYTRPDVMQSVGYPGPQVPRYPKREAHKHSLHWNKKE